MKSKIMSKIELLKTQEDMNVLIQMYHLNTHVSDVSVAKMDRDSVLLLTENGKVWILWFNIESSKTNKFEISQFEQLIGKYQKVHSIKINVSNAADLVLNILCKIYKKKYLSELKSIEVNKEVVNMITQFNDEVKKYVCLYLGIRIINTVVA